MSETADCLLGNRKGHLAIALHRPVTELQRICQLNTLILTEPHLWVLRSSGNLMLKTASVYSSDAQLFHSSAFLGFELSVSFAVHQVILLSSRGWGALLSSFILATSSIVGLVFCPAD